ncbi:GNAT family N-acetyltransferase [soil metagenome]
MLQCNFSPFPQLLTDHLLLRRVEAEDINEIFFLRSDKEVLKYLDKPVPTYEETIVFIKKVQDWEAKNEAIQWGICLKEDNKIIGTIGFWRMQPEHYRAEIGYVLHPGFHGKGIMDEAMKAVLDYGFREMKLHSVEANVNPLNVASARVLEKNNFMREGYFKENYFYNGSFIDSAIYSLISPFPF